MLVLVVMVVMVMTLMVADMATEEMKRNNRYAEVEEVEEVTEVTEVASKINYSALEQNAKNTARYYFKKYLKTIGNIKVIELEIKGAPLKVLAGEYTENNAEEITSAWKNKLQELKKEAETYAALNTKYWNVVKTFHNKAMKVA